MNLRKTLTPSVVYPSIDASTKDEAITGMVRLLARANGVDDIDPLLTAVFDRERKDSTGLEYGIAVPHGKTNAVDRLFAGIGRLVTPVDFGTRDGSMVWLLVMTISPLGKTGPHLQYIGEVVRILRDEARRDALLAATDAAAMYRAMIR